MSAGEKWRPLLRREDTPEQLTRNIDAEFDAHFELRVEQLMAEGLSEEEARARAESLLGDAGRAAELCERTDRTWLVRERAGHFFSSIVRDAAHALRIFRNSPFFAVMASLCLAVGITFITVTWTILDDTLIHPLPFEDADELVMVGTDDSVPNDWHWMWSSYPDFLDWEAGNHVFEHLALFSWRTFTITDLDEPRRVSACEVTDAFTDVLKVAPVLGRGFTLEDYLPGAEPVILIGHGLWQRAWGGDPGILGRSITLDGVNRYQVVGVMPPHFTFPDFRELWIPFQRDEPLSRAADNYITFGRLRDGVPLEAARTEMHQIGIQVAARYPEIEERPGVQVVRFGPFLFDPLRMPLLVIFVVACLVLLLACSNLANLMLSRATGRTRELTLRAVLGAGRGRLIQQVLIESLVIAMIGGLLGIIFGRLGLNLLLAEIPRMVPGFMRFEMNPGVLLALSGFVVLSGLLFGLAPALAVRSGGLGVSLRNDENRMSSGRKHTLIRSGLVVIQVALVTIILVVTGMALKSSISAGMARFDGMNEHLLGQEVRLESWAYPESELRYAFFHTAVDRIRQIPGVEGAFFSTSLIPDRPEEASLICSNESGQVNERPFFYCASWVVSPGYFALLGIPVSAGRTFSELSEGERSNAIIVNEAAAARLWPDGIALGRTCYLSDTPDPERAFTVTGVIPDERSVGSESGAMPRIYLPLRRRMSGAGGWLVAHSTQSPRDLAPVVRETIHRIDPHLPLSVPRTVAEVVREAHWQTVLFSWILGVIAIFALTLALVGIVAVVSFMVASRRQEFGIRLALGARSTTVIRTVLGAGATMAGLGISIGLAIALFAMRFLSGMLAETDPRDPVVYVFVIGFLISVTLLASWLPARRATAVDPISCLRQE